MKVMRFSVQMAWPSFTKRMNPWHGLTASNLSTIESIMLSYPGWPTTTSAADTASFWLHPTNGASGLMLCHFLELSRIQDIAHTTDIPHCQTVKRHTISIYAAPAQQICKQKDLLHNVI
jgi:hypothetical protein